MYICIYAHMYIYIYICTTRALRESLWQIHSHTHTHTLYIYIYIYIFIYICLYLDKYTHMIYLSLYIYIYIYMDWLSITRDWCFRYYAKPDMCGTTHPHDNQSHGRNWPTHFDDDALSLVWIVGTAKPTHGCTVCAIPRFPHGKAQSSFLKSCTWALAEQSILPMLNTTSLFR